MDGIGDFLKVSPLNGYPPVKPRESPNLKPITAPSQTPYSINLHGPISVPGNLYNPSPDQSVGIFSSEPLEMNIPQTASSFSMSGGGFAEPTYTLLSNEPAQQPGGPQLGPQAPEPYWNESIYMEPIPQMPTYTDAQDDGGDDGSDHGDGMYLPEERQTGKKQKGRQRTSGPLSAHAIYARMNRERKKKYIADLEKYRVTMKRKNAEGERELEQIQRESMMLTAEIVGLRNELTGNQRLMSLLNLGHRGQ